MLTDLNVDFSCHGPINAPQLECKYILLHFHRINHDLSPSFKLAKHKFCKTSQQMSYQNMLMKELAITLQREKKKGVLKHIIFRRDISMCIML